MRLAVDFIELLVERGNGHAEPEVFSSHSIIQFYPIPKGGCRVTTECGTVTVKNDYDVLKKALMVRSVG